MDYLLTQKAFQYYQDKSEGLGFEFMRSMDAALQSVKRNPLAFQKFIKKPAEFYFANFLMRFSILPKKIESWLLPVFTKNGVKLIDCGGYNFYNGEEVVGGWIVKQ